MSSVCDTFHMGNFSGIASVVTFIIRSSGKLYTLPDRLYLWCLHTRSKMQIRKIHNTMHKMVKNGVHTVDGQREMFFDFLQQLETLLSKIQQLQRNFETSENYPTFLRRILDGQEDMLHDIVLFLQFSLDKEMPRLLADFSKNAKSFRG